MKHSCCIWGVSIEENRIFSVQEVDSTHPQRHNTNASTKGPGQEYHLSVLTTE